MWGPAEKSEREKGDEEMWCPDVNRDGRKGFRDVVPSRRKRRERG